MIKEKTLKKKILIEAGALTAFLVFLGVVSYIGSSISASMSDDKTNLMGANSALISENDKIQKHIEKASSSIKLYQVLVENNRNRNFNIDREVGSGVFSALKEKYHLNLQGNNSFAQIIELTDEQFKKKTAKIVLSDADMNFQATTDELALQFIKELYKKLSGFMVITSFQMNKQSNITNQILLDIGAGKFPSTVSAGIKFKWIGLKPNPKAPQSDNAGAPATGNTP